MIMASLGIVHKIEGEKKLGFFFLKDKSRRIAIRPVRRSLNDHGYI